MDYFVGGGSSHWTDVRPQHLAWLVVADRDVSDDDVLWWTKTERHLDTQRSEYDSVFAFLPKLWFVLHLCGSCSSCLDLLVGLE